MAKITLNPRILSMHGRIGNIIFYNVCGFQYARSLTIPLNPRTEAQQKNRASFAEAVKLWQQLSEKEKTRYNKKAARKPMSGYNLFISMTMKGLTALTVKSGEVRVFSILSSYLLRSTSVPYTITPAFPFYQASNGPPVLTKPSGFVLNAA
ncbi:MAG TPA: hypothetical protein PK358_08645 [Spirochaetota bacterium]|nr:hypothetical protein [Spirochaetota bacterium]